MKPLILAAIFMCPMSHKRYCAKQHSRFDKQRGSMLVIALFILIVLAILGVAMLKMLAASADSVVSEVYGQRALNAARSGVERAISGAFPLSGVSSCPATYNITFTNTPGLLNCNYASACDVISVDDSGDVYQYFRFTAQGSCIAGDTVVSRNVSVEGIQ